MREIRVSVNETEDKLLIEKINKLKILFKEKTMSKTIKKIIKEFEIK